MRKNLSAVNNVLNQVMSKLGLDKRLREHTFLTLWPTFVSAAIADRSRPLFIDADRNLVVSVADSATGQELSMCKPRILAKLAPAARSLGIDITGIRLDLKHYHSATTIAMHPLASDQRLKQFTDDDLAAIELSASDLAEIAQLAQDLAQQNPGSSTSGRMVKLFEREFRIRSWRLSHNYPRCEMCTNPIERPYKRRTGLPERPHAMVCLACFYV